MLDLFPSDKKILSVSELTRLIKSSLESTFPRVWIQGEISNAKLHSSGHFYFTLKDEGAQLSAVMWRSRVQSLLFSPEDGMKVQARGTITVYPPRGSYQIDVTSLLPLGVGELQLAFEELKRRLAAEGLFDESHKRPIPDFPERIGIITSPTGAAIQDIRSVLERRFPSAEAVIIPVRVQGAGAAEEIAGGIRLMNRFGEVDVMIVGRGGGSLEDLWAFNEETVARAIYESKIPVVSAVGHEVDFTIADFVADLRAPTPSAAAELVVPERTEILELLRNSCYTMSETLSERIRLLSERVATLIGSYSFNRPKDLLLQYSQRIDELERAMTAGARRIVEQRRDRHLNLLQRLQSLGPANVLKRGYTIVRKDGKPVTHATLLKRGEKASIEFQDGILPARIEDE